MKIYEQKPLDGRKSFYKKAIVREDNRGKVLCSYGTPVLRLDESGHVFRLWGGYSRTTMRHINSFLADNGANGGGKAWWDRMEVVDV